MTDGAAVAAAAASAPPLVIAVVDDDEVDRLAVHRALLASHPNATIVFGERARDARRLVETESPDCLFLDLQLPDGDGREVVEELRRLGFDVPIVIMTGHGDEQTAVALMKAGASDYIPKAALSAERVGQSVRRGHRLREAERGERAARAALEGYALRLRSLVDASARAHTTLTVEGASRVVAEAAQRIVGAHVSVVRVLAEERPHTGTGEVRAIELSDRDWNIAPALVPGRPLGEELGSLVGVVRFERAALEADPAALSLARSLGLGLPLRGWLVAPISSRTGHVVGVVHLSDKIAGEFTASDEIVLAQLAQTASVALDNAALFEATKAASQARDDLLAVVSHDLRDPLNTIVMASSILRDAPPADPVKHREHVERISRAAARMLRLVADLLDVTRIESGLLTLVKEPQQVARVVEEAVDSLRTLAIDAGVRLEAVVDPGLPPIVVDRDRFVQTFGNLIGNALKFTPKDGLVQVRARASAGAVVFSVVDTGVGIGPADLPRLFDRHFQGRSRAQLGAGLGLFIAKGIVEAHGGRIWVESEVGTGTSCFFTVPAAIGAVSIAG